MDKILRALLILILSVLLGGGVVSAQDDDVVDVPGRIAYIGNDNNVYTLSLMDDDLVQMTDDATDSRRYQWPTWADNDKLAYFCCNSFFSSNPDTEIFVSEDGVAPGELVFVEPNTALTYAGWSPSDCNQGINCRDLAILLSQFDSSVFAVDVIRSNALGANSQRVGEGAPFYYSWSPDGERMLIQRNNRNIEIYSVETEGVDKIQQLPGLFQAPEWSPVDDRLLMGSAGVEAGTTDLVIVANGETQVLQAALNGLVSFNWSPDGNYVAYRFATSELISPLYVIDSVTGEPVATSEVEDVISFFWAPDSSMVGYITPASPRGSFNAGLPEAQPIAAQNAPTAQQDDGIAWAALDVQTGESRFYGGFIPTQEMVYLLNFFDQFAQSHQLWSPDSRYVVYSELTEDGDTIISILDMTREDSVPFSVADGVIGIWSYR